MIESVLGMISKIKTARDIKILKKEVKKIKDEIREIPYQISISHYEAAINALEMASNSTNEEDRKHELYSAKTSLSEAYFMLKNFVNDKDSSWNPLKSDEKLKALSLKSKTAIITNETYKIIGSNNTEMKIAALESIKVYADFKYRLLYIKLKDIYQPKLFYWYSHKSLDFRKQELNKLKLFFNDEILTKFLELDELYISFWIPSAGAADWYGDANDGGPGETLYKLNTDIQNMIERQKNNEINDVENFLNQN